MENSERTIINMAIACCVSADNSAPKQEKIDLLRQVKDRLDEFKELTAEEKEDYRKIIEKSLKFLEAE